MSKNKQSPQSIEQLVSIAFPNDKMISFKELTEGLCNAAYLIELGSGIKTVLKISSADNSSFLRNEKDMSETEAAALKYMEGLGIVMVPKVYYYDFSRTVCSGKYIFMKALDGDSFSSVSYSMGEEERNDIYFGLGKIVSKLSSVKGKFFGSFVNSGLQYDSLYDLVFAMFTNLFDDIEDKHLDHGVDRTEIFEKLTEDKDIFSDVAQPSLIHNDIWEGNIFIKHSRIIGVIDWERTMWGDPLMEEYFRSHRYVKAFYEGFGRSELNANEKRRVYWYDLFLCLTMLTEPFYRDYEDKECFNDWLIPNLKEACSALALEYHK